ncbi:MAG: hypothetical protein ACRDQH_05415, partial [Pseudonocardiaceae bacterium]
MGALLGLAFGIGLLLIWRGGSRRPSGRTRTGSWSRQRAELLRQAGVDGVSSAQLVLIQAAAALVVAVIVLVATGTVAIAACFAVMGFFVPIALVRRLRSKR